MGATDRFLKRGRIQDFSRGPIAKMLSELKKFGANGRLYIPGVGAISGITAGNYLDSTGTTNASVDGNVGLVKDQLGSSNATQSTTGYQPKLRRGLVNYQLNSVPIGGQWVAEATGTGVVPAVTYNYATAPGGSSAARAILDKGAGTTSADLSQFRAGNSTVVSGAPYTSAIWLRTTVDGATAAVSLRDNIAASTLIVTDQWQLFVRSGNAISNTMSVGVRLRPSEATSSQADILVGAAGIFQGTLTAAQILAAGGIPVTATAPASSPAGACKWDFSTDDYLAQSSAPFGFADDHYIASAGVCNASAGVISTLASVGGSAAGHVSLDVMNGLVRANWTGSAQILSTLAAPDGIPFVASLTKIGNTGKVSKNGAKAAGVDLTSVVAVTTTAATVGARCLSTLSSFHNGGIYGVIEAKGTVSDAQDLIFQRGLNALAQYAAGRF